MKKLLLLALTAVMTAGCIVEHYKETRINSDYSVRVIDSCEYILLNDVGIKAHKGNCKYCEERKKQRDSLMKQQVMEWIKELKEK